MKHNFFILVILFYAKIVSAQITISDNDVFGIGDVVYQGVDINPQAFSSLFNPGANQTWDLTSLSSSYIDTLKFFDPNNTLYSNLYPNANLCLDEEDLNYFNITSQGIYFLGIKDTVFNNPLLFIPLPLSNGQTYSEGPIVIADEVISGPFLSIAIPPSVVSILTGNLANRADSAVIQVNSTVEYIVDGEGEVILPMGSCNALRMKGIRNDVSVLNVYCVDTISQQGIWVNNVPFSSIPFLAGYSNNETQIRYQWLTNDPNYEFLLVEMFVDSLDNILGGISFQTANTTSVNEYYHNSISVYPVPGKKVLYIDTHNLNELTYSILDVNGRLLKTDSFVQKIKINISDFSSGVYTVRILDNKTHVIKRIVIE